MVMGGNLLANVDSDAVHWLHLLGDFAVYFSGTF
jgi:hypothetical protein